MGLNSNQIYKCILPTEQLCGSGPYFEDLSMLPTLESLLI